MGTFSIFSHVSMMRGCQKHSNGNQYLPKLANWFSKVHRFHGSNKNHSHHNFCTKEIPIRVCSVFDVSICFGRIRDMLALSDRPDYRFHCFPTRNQKRHCLQGLQNISHLTDSGKYALMPRFPFRTQYNSR